MFEQMNEEQADEVRRLMRPAARIAARIAGEVPADRLDAPTPCPDWDVRALVNHMILWNGRARTAALGRPPEGPGEEHDFTAGPGWAARFAEQAAATADAWSEPAAWTGATSLVGAENGMPASYIGGIVFGEYVLHGWDLATALGRDPGLPPELVGAAHRLLAGTAETARRYGAFGPEVPVAASAPPLHRLAGLAGRDPAWTP